MRRLFNERNDVPLETNKIHQGDCVENLKRVEAESVDLIFADPPFNIGYKYDVYDDRQQAEDYLAWCGQWLCRRPAPRTQLFWQGLHPLCALIGLCLSIAWIYTNRPFVKPKTDLNCRK